MNVSHRHHALFIACFLLLTAFYARDWYRVMGDPVLLASDFMNYYAAAQLPLSDLYNMEAQRAAGEEAIGERFGPDSGMMYFTHPPHLVPAAQAVIGRDYFRGYVAWSTVALLASLACGAVLAIVFREQGWTTANSLSAASAVMLFPPVFLNVIKTSDTPFVLLGALLWARWALAGKEAKAGAALALTTIKPHFALPLCGSQLFRRRAFAAAFVACLLTLAYCFALVGWQGVTDYARVASAVASGGVRWLNPQDMFNLRGILERAGVASMGVVWGAYALSLALAALLWRKGWERGALIGLTCLLTVFFSPHVHEHDLNLLVVSAGCGLILAVKRGSLRERDAAGVALLIAILFAVVDNFARGWRHALAYALMLALASLSLALRACASPQPDDSSIPTA